MAVQINRHVGHNPPALQLPLPALVHRRAANVAARFGRGRCNRRGNQRRGHPATHALCFGHSRHRVLQRWTLDAPVQGMFDFMADVLPPPLRYAA